MLALYGFLLDPSDAASFQLARVLFALLLAFSYPLQLNPFRATFERLFVRSDEKRAAFSTHIYLISTSLFLFITFGITLARPPDLTDVLGLMGALTSSTVCYILPSLYYYKLTEDEPMSFFKFCAIVLGIFGVVVLLLCSSASIYKMSVGY